jgi:membrane protein DedA with SNARE-associated domain
MDWSALLHEYGYLMIFLGTLAEGETVLMLGGYFAHRGHLNLAGVIATAFVGAVCGDQLFFHLGRSHAKALLERFPRLRAKVNIALHRVEQHQVKIVLSMRFLWGLRIALPVSLGLTSMNARKFLWLNLVSAAIWACVFGSVGFGAGRVIARVVSSEMSSEKWVALGLILLAVGVLWIRWHGSRKVPPPSQG